MSGTRQPIPIVLADGAAVAGVMDAEITSGADGSADRFTLQVALGASGLTLDSWSQMTDSVLEVLVQLEDQAASLMTGQIDTIVADPVFGTLRIGGRDLRSRLVQAQTQESFANQSSSDIASLLAARHGLDASVTDTSMPVGRYYSADYTQVTLNRQARICTEWDLLLQLAEQEGFDVFVQGTTLYFQPPNGDLAPQAVLHTSWDDTGPPTVTSLRLNRRMVVAGNITVTVNSWNSQTQSMVSGTATRPGSNARPARYLYSRPNLASDRAQALATSKLDAITRHEVTIDAAMLGDTAIFPRGMVAVSGTNSLFDAVYSVDEVTRTISARQGFTQSVRAHLPGGYGSGA